MTNITVIGTGYVGLVAAVGLADFGNRVIGADIQHDKIAALEQGRSPIFEAGIETYLERNLDAGRLSFTADTAAAGPLPPPPPSAALPSAPLSRKPSRDCRPPESQT